jgi:hypothetical protein
MTDVQDARVSNMAIPIFHAPELLSALEMVACPVPTIRNPGFWNDDGGPGPGSAVAHFSWELGGKDHGGSQSPISQGPIFCALES